MIGLGSWGCSAVVGGRIAGGGRGPSGHTLDSWDGYSEEEQEEEEAHTLILVAAVIGISDPVAVIWT
jgi:hypothetical protein